jgi:hypothetical protein
MAKDRILAAGKRPGGRIITKNRKFGLISFHDNVI